MIDTNYAWSTHQPLIKAALKSYDVKFILEMGIGVFSTPTFIMSGIDSLFVENDENWIRYMNYYCNKDLKCIHHTVAIPNQDVGYDFLTPVLINELNEYYNQLRDNIKDKKGVKLLFVDNYSSCRAITINTLYSVFDIIIFHDYEPQSIQRQNYYFNNDLESSYQKYVLTSPKTWTGCFIKNELTPIAEETIKPIIDIYKADNEVEYMEFKKI